MSERDGATDWFVAAALFVGLFVLYNANGREIGSFDTQGTKLAARELLLRGTLALDHVVGATPEYLRRWGFIHAADGRYRSIYSPVPSVMAALVTWPLWKLRIIDIRAPLAPGLMAAVTAALLTALSVVLAFWSARQRLSRARAALVAVALGAGTGYWSTVSQTLWQTESAVLGLSIAVLAFAAPDPHISGRAAAAVGIGLGLAGATRPQLAPIVAVLLVGTWARTSVRGAAAAIIIMVIFVGAIAAYNMRSFGNPLGALPLLEAQNSLIHASGETFRLSAEGFAGLLVSPSRGLLVFSPIVLVAVAGARQAWFENWCGPLRWCVLAIAAQFALYGSYSVWWGGHTFGPRYMLDVLPLAVPLAAAWLTEKRLRPVLATATAAALVWSIGIAATGAFCYPNDRWNIDPNDVDRNHARLWSWSDNQIWRCWKRGPSPQNFTLFDRAAVRPPARPTSGHVPGAE